jgi:ornithine cyclodeaminase/alanine dehydrogenase-like protein (mu-crystallin family)
MPTRILDREDVAWLLHKVGRHEIMDEVIAALHASLRDYDSRVIEVRKRDGFNYDRRRGARFGAHSVEETGGLLEWMPVLDFGADATIKIVSYNPQNPQRFSIPTILATICRFDIKSGRLLALCDGVLLTALRTGAASAIATRVLAHPDARSVGIIGTGAQAVTQLHALSRVMKIDHVYGFDTDPQAAHSFASRVEFLGLDVQIVDLERLEAAADVIVTATSVAVGKGPVFPGRDLRPHLHVNAIGADVPGKFECPRELVETALVCPDFLAQAVVEGECQQIPEEQIGPSLIQLVKKPEEYSRYRASRTVFDSTGFALEDKVALEVFIKYADQYDIGATVEIEAIPADPLNPYSLPEVALRVLGRTAGTK